MNFTLKAKPNETHDSYLLSFEPEKAVALTMNFPQHHSSVSKMVLTENNQIEHQRSHCNHNTIDSPNCLDCISTMFGPNYAPFAAFMNEFSQYAQTQKIITMKQNDLIENFLSYYQQQHPKKPTLNQQELQHVFTYGTWSNGKQLFSSNPQQLIGISLITISIYLTTIRDNTDPVLAFIRGYSRFYGDKFQYLNIILALIGIGTLYISTAIAYFSGLIGHSIIITIIALLFNILGLLSVVIFICIILFLGDRMKVNLPIVLELNMVHFESDSSTNSLSYSWTLMHRKYHCCMDGILITNKTVPEKSALFMSLHPGWLVPESCCISNDILCVQVPTVNNSFINSSCIEFASKHFNELLSNFNFILLPIIFLSMISNIYGIVYLMNLKISIHKMNVNNNELSKSLFALKSRYITTNNYNDIIKNPIEKFQEMKTNNQHLHIPGYFPITPSILQVRKPEQNSYLHYGL